MVVILYSKSCGCSSVDEARQWLFSNGNKSLEKLPPTVAALTQQLKKALLQVSFYWNQATSIQQHIPDFIMWGCYLDSKRLGNLTRPIFQMLIQPVPFSSIATAICSGHCKC